MIYYIKWGIAYTVGSNIYLNKNLLKYPKIEQKIVQHEQHHVNGEHDIDFREQWDSEIFKFILNHPSTWLQIIPIWIIRFCGKRILVYSKTMFLLWLLFALIALSMWWLTHGL